MAAFSFNETVGRASVGGSLTETRLRKIAEFKPRILDFDSVEKLSRLVVRLESVTQIRLRGRCSIPSFFFECLPNLEALRAEGDIRLGLSGKPIRLKSVAVTDLTSSISDLLSSIQTERLDVTGHANSLVEAVLGQERLSALRLQETTLDLLDVEPVLSRLKVLCLYRTQQKHHRWMQKTTELESLSIAFQKNLENLAPIGDLLSLMALDISSQRKLSGFQHLGQLRRLKLLSLLNLGTIPSIGWISSLPELRILKILGNCTIADGKVAFLTKLPLLTYVGIQSRRDYDANVDILSKVSALEGLKLGEALGF